MQSIELRPDLRTAGGEVSDIMVSGRFAGTFAMVYREGDRAAGCVQLEKESLAEEEKDRVISFIHSYIQSFAGAVQAEECDVIVTYGSFERVVTIGGERYSVAGGVDPNAADYEESDEFELVVVNEKRNRIDYHVYNA